LPLLRVWGDRLTCFLHQPDDFVRHHHIPHFIVFFSSYKLSAINYIIVWYGSIVS
jgi:hypothetical protein